MCWIYHTLLIQSTVGRHGGNVCFWVIVNGAAMGILEHIVEHVLLWSLDSVSHATPIVLGLLHQAKILGLQQPKLCSHGHKPSSPPAWVGERWTKQGGELFPCHQKIFLHKCWSTWYFILLLVTSFSFLGVPDRKIQPYWLFFLLTQRFQLYSYFSW